MANGYFAAMLDCSRNGVIKVNKVKEFIDILSKFGYNALELYTEDTFEVEGEPYFGYMRGGYTKAQIRELDLYAKERGIELIPCIQTLAHLNAIFKWHVYDDINDNKDILLIDEEKTYELIDKMFASLRECYSSNLIHIGMDEAEMVGLGSYLKKHGFQNRYALLNKHLKRVIEIASKYGFKPKMWSDMFFKMAAGKYALDDFNSVPDEMVKAVPSGVNLVYWNYYQAKDVLYSKMLKVHKRIDNDCWFAGSAWAWLGFAPCNHWSIKHLTTSMNACRKQGVNNVLITVWGDDGQECSHFAVLSSLFYAIKVYQGEKSIAKIKKEFFEITGESFNAFLDLDLPNAVGKNQKEFRCFNPCKYGFYSDLLNGFTDLHVPEGSGELYKRYAKRLKKHAKNSKNYRYIFETMSALCDFLSVKFELGKRLRTAYKSGDREKLEVIYKDIRKAEGKLVKFELAHKKRWNEDFYPQGYDVQDVRIGALKQRLKTARERLEEYLTGRVETIPELEVDLLSASPWGDELLTFGKWKDIVTINTISHNT